MIGLDLIAGNVCSLCAMVSDSVSGTRKTNRQILALQSLSQIFYGVGSIILKGYSSTAQNVVAILRNLAAMKGIKNKVVEWTLVILGVVLGVAFNNRGLAGWLPVIGNLEYSIAVFKFKDDERSLKVAFLISVLMFAAFNVVIMNIVGLIVNAVVVISTVTFLCKKN